MVTAINAACARENTAAAVMSRACDAIEHV